MSCTVCLVKWWENFLESLKGLDLGKWRVGENMRGILLFLSPVWLLGITWIATHQVPCSSLSPGICSNSCPLSRRYCPTISSSVTLFSTCPQSFPTSGKDSFPMHLFFSSSNQSIGASASGSLLPMNIQCWFSLGLTGLISLQSKGLSKVFSSTTIWNSLVLSLLYGPALTSVHDYGKIHSLLGPYYFSPLSCPSVHEMFPCYLQFSWRPL